MMNKYIFNFRSKQTLQLSMSAVVGLYLLFMSGCADGIHLYDQSQVPVITIQNRKKPVFSFTPSSVYIIRVYQGKQDGDGLNVFWKQSNGDGYENNLTSPVTYSGPDLKTGKHYTVTVERKDPKGSGDGFTNTRHKYVGKKTFIAK